MSETINDIIAGKTGKLILPVKAEPTVQSAPRPGDTITTIVAKTSNAPKQPASEKLPRDLLVVRKKHKNHDI